MLDLLHITRQLFGQLQSSSGTTSLADLFDRESSDNSASHLLRNLLKHSHAQDALWIDLFLEHFIKTHSKKSADDSTDAEDDDQEMLMMDDLLFFVTAPHQSPLTQDTADPPAAPPPPEILVRRKQENNQLPSLDHIIAWKDSFLLNLVLHTNYIMTVSICEKRSSNVNEAMISQGNNKSNDNGATSSVPSGSGSIRQKTMFTLKSIRKPVYASINRIRLDKNKSSRTEIAYPSIYFMVSDHEEAFEDLVIEQGQHLVVELSAWYRYRPELLSADSPSSSKRISANSASSVRKECTLFQGAVPYDILLSAYQSKHQQQQQPLAVLSRFVAKQFSSFNPGVTDRNHRGSVASGTNSQSEENRQFILMRGPNGKGFAQVAVFHRPDLKRTPATTDATPGNLKEPERQATEGTTSPKSVASAPSSTNPSTVSLDTAIANTLRRISSPFISKSNSQQTSTAQTPYDQSNNSTSSVWSYGSSRKPSSQDMVLECQMTFIHLHWEQIVRDLFDEASETLRIHSSERNL